MGKLTWDKFAERLYENGISHGVLYPLNSGTGVAWNGIISISDSPSGGEVTAVYADNGKYVNIATEEELEVSLESYSYPGAFDSCLGKGCIIPGLSIGGQKKEHFGLCYRTENAPDNRYKLHIMFDCVATQTQRDRSTINETPEGDTFNCDIYANKVRYSGYKPTASLVLDSREFYKAGMMHVLRAIEGILYGTDDTAPKLPTFAEIMDTIQYTSYLTDENGTFITDNTGNNIGITTYQ